MTLTFTVPGPPVGQGSKRHVGHGVMVEASKHLRPYRALVTDAAMQAIAAHSPRWDRLPATRPAEVTRRWWSTFDAVRVSIQEGL